MRRFMMFILLLCIAIDGICYPTRSSVGARQFLHSDGESVSYSASDYVQNGLVAMWDAVENAGWGEHVDQSSEWLDLINGFYLRAGGDAVGDFSNGYMDRAVTFWNGEGDPSNPQGNRYYDKMVALKVYVNGGMFTIEIVHRPHLKGLSSFQTANYGLRFLGLANSHTSLAIAMGGTVSVYKGILESGTSFAASPCVDMELESRTFMVDKASGYLTIMKNGNQDAMAPLNSSIVWNGANNGPLMVLPTCIGFSATGNQNNWSTSQQGYSDIYSFRIYGKVLSEEEIQWNLMIDRARFGL